MQDPQTLMRPLGSDSLKPRAFSQAASAPIPERICEIPDLPDGPSCTEPDPAQEPETMNFSEPPQEPAPVQDDPRETSAEEWPPEENDHAVEISKSQELDSIIADVLSGDDEEEDEEEDDDDGFDDEPSPVRSAKITLPPPAFVPLYDEPDRPRRRPGCLWALLPLLAVLAGYAGWMLLN